MLQPRDEQFKLGHYPDLVCRPRKPVPSHVWEARHGAPVGRDDPTVPGCCPPLPPFCVNSGINKDLGPDLVYADFRAAGGKSPRFSI